MAAPCLQVLSNSVTRVSSDSDLPTSGEPQGPPIPDEVSPLLKPKRTQAHRQTISERWWTAQSSLLNDNSGLLLIAASQFFFSAMGIAVKWLNGLDDPVPTLEVCMTHRGRIFFPRPDRFRPYTQLIQVRMVRSHMLLRCTVSETDGELGCYIRLLSCIYVHPPLDGFRDHP
jgi:hypothetical protein